MKKLEIKSVGVTSMGKTTVYIMLIPMAILLLIGFFALLIGILIQKPEVAIFGGVYMFIPIFMLALYGAISMLVGLIYNWLAGKFGGLEITLTEVNTVQIPYSTNNMNNMNNVNNVNNKIDTGNDDEVTTPTN